MSEPSIKTGLAIPIDDFPPDCVPDTLYVPVYKCNEPLPPTLIWTEIDEIGSGGGGGGVMRPKPQSGKCGYKQVGELLRVMHEACVKVSIAITSMVETPEFQQFAKTMSKAENE